MHDLNNIDPSAVLSRNPPLATNDLSTQEIDWASMTPFGSEGGQWNFGFKDLSGSPHPSSHSPTQGAGDASRRMLGEEIQFLAEAPPNGPAIDASSHRDRGVGIVTPLDLALHTSRPTHAFATHVEPIGTPAGESSEEDDVGAARPCDTPAASTHRECNPDKPVVPLCTRLKPDEAQRAAQKITARLNKEKNEKISADVLKLMAAREKEDIALAAKYSVSVARIKQFMGAPQVVKPKRRPNIGNAIFRRKALEYNKG